VKEYEEGERLFWFDSIVTIEEEMDLPMDAPERFATVTCITPGDTAWIRYDDGLTDEIPLVNLPDYFERVV
jgi:hypothetical protein